MLLVAAPGSQVCDVCPSDWEGGHLASAHFLAPMLASSVTLATSFHLSEPVSSALKGYKIVLTALQGCSEGNTPVPNRALGMLQTLKQKLWLLLFLREEATSKCSIIACFVVICGSCHMEW